MLVVVLIGPSVVEYTFLLLYQNKEYIFVVVSNTFVFVSKQRIHFCFCIQYNKQLFVNQQKTDKQKCARLVVRFFDHATDKDI